MYRLLDWGSGAWTPALGLLALTVPASSSYCLPVAQGLMCDFAALATTPPPFSQLRRLVSAPHVPVLVEKARAWAEGYER